MTLERSELISLIISSSLLFQAFSAPLECSINITQGVPWTIGNSSYNFASLNVETQQGLVTPDYPIGIVTDGNLTSYWNWNASNQTSGMSLGYWQSLVDLNPVDFGVILGSNNSASPEVLDVSLNGEMCDVGPPMTVEPVGRTEAALQPVSIQNGVLIGTDGKPLVMRGLNWFGMEEPGNSMLDGLWIGSDSITKDFATIVYRYQLLGFNAVRLPFNFQNLYNLAPSSISVPCNIDSQQTIAQSTLDPAANADASTAPGPVAPPTQTPGTCNAYLPQDTTINRFLAIIRYFAQNNFYVIIDNHLNLDPTAINDPAGWAKYWQMLAGSVAADPISAPWTMFEILNEPDSKNLRWEPYNGLPGAGDLTLNAMQMIYDVAPNSLLLVEGTGQTAQGLCWYAAVKFVFFQRYQI